MDHKGDNSLRRRLSISVKAVFLAMLITGCGEGRRSVDPNGGPSGGEGPTAADLTAAGWVAFEGADFTGAEASFRGALAADATFAEAHNGAGWSLMNLGRLGEANDAFEAALAGSLGTADPYAGRAAVLRDREPVDYATCIYSARDALAMEPRYQFAHDESFDWRDLRLIIGQASWELGSYETVKHQIDSLGGRVQSDTSSTFAEDLLRELERLAGEIQVPEVED